MYILKFSKLLFFLRPKDPLCQKTVALLHFLFVYLCMDGRSVQVPEFYFEQFYCSKGFKHTLPTAMCTGHKFVNSN